MNKKSKTSILIASLIILILNYVAFSFVIMSYDCSKWKLEQRFAMVLIDFISIIIFSNIEDYD